MKDWKPTGEALTLLMEGQMAYARIEATGVRVDRAYLETTIKETEGRLAVMETELRSGKVARLWKKTYGDKTNFESNTQLAHVVFDRLGYESKDTTATGQRQVSKKVLEQIDHPFVVEYLKVKPLRVALRTFLVGIRRELVRHADGDWYVHPHHNLNTTQTYRPSCIAKGTMIEVVRDVAKNPRGVPIEKVRAGDYVYCYDGNLNLAVRRVLWAGRTGFRRVVRVHWQAGRGKRGFVDVTPEHKIRGLNGRYVRAEDLAGELDLRTKRHSKHRPKKSVLAMGRARDFVYQTGKPDGIKDHRLIYESVIGPLSEEEVVHHKDGNHYNNVPANLRKMSSPSEHAALHAPELLTDAVRRKAFKVRLENLAKYGYRGPRGGCHHRWKHLSKFSLLRMLARAGGESSKVTMDFETFKRKAKLLGVDLPAVRDRYDRLGRYISLARLIRLAPLGVNVCIKEFGKSYRKVQEVFAARGVELGLRSGVNQFTVNNHSITRVEWIDKKTEVYDIKVEGLHNFIANEICVHNSDKPNWRNFPKRNPEIAELVRKAYVPRKGRRFGENDYGQIEIRVPAALTGDEELRRYVLDKSTDMHRDQACAVFFLPKDGVPKNVRSQVKNNFVFCTFYGGSPAKSAKGLWEDVGVYNLCTAGGVPLKDYLKEKGVTRLGSVEEGAPVVEGTFVHHVRECQRKLWNRFKGYAAWRKRTTDRYHRDGGLVTATGFVVTGDHSPTEIPNYPIQGPAYHCTLSAVVMLLPAIKKYRMKTLVLGDIYDSIQADVPKGETRAWLDLCHDVMTRRVPEKYPWLKDIPLEIECELSEVNGSWFGCKEWVRKEGVWSPRLT